VSPPGHDPGGELFGLRLAVAKVVQVEVATTLGREEQRVLRVRRLAFERGESDRLQRHRPQAGGGHVQTWRTSLRPGGVLAFSPRPADSPRPGVLFRECAARRGIELPNRNEIVGTPERCREMLDRAGYEGVNIIAETIAPAPGTRNRGLAEQLNSRRLRASRRTPPKEVLTLRDDYLRSLTPEDLRRPYDALRDRTTAGSLATSVSFCRTPECRVHLPTVTSASSGTARIASNWPGCERFDEVVLEGGCNDVDDV
jgi:hypothetical protein